jgi:hypothetical protein
MILLISISQVAGITGVSHHTQDTAEVFEATCKVTNVELNLHKVG